MTGVQTCALPIWKVPVMEWATRFCDEGGWDAPADQDEADALAIAHAAEQWWLAQDA